jgi:outer membrane protein assembly factor BamB
MSSAVINGDLLYGFSHYDKGRLFCLDSKTGEILWQGPGRTGVNATFLSVSGYVLALIDNGELQVIRASGSQFEKAASYRVTQNASWAPPVLLSDGILVKDVKTLTMWSLSSE